MSDRPNSPAVRFFSFGIFAIVLIIAALEVRIVRHSEQPSAPEPTVFAMIRRAPGFARQLSDGSGRDDRLMSLLDANSKPLPELKAWVAQGDATKDRPFPTMLIGKNSLSAIKCLQVGVILAQAGSPDGSTWIEAGFDRANALLSRSKRNDRAVHSLLVALENAQDALAGHVEAGPLLIQMNGVILRFDRFAPWDEGPEWARIHYVEALVLEGRNAEAKSKIDAISGIARTDSHWTNNERMELLSVMSRIPYAPEATSPLDVLRIHQPPPKELIAWIQCWQKSRSRTDPEAIVAFSQAMAGNLSETINRSDLSAIECLRISELMADGGDASNQIAFAAAGVTRAAVELSTLTSRTSSIQPMVQALERAEDRLWKSPGDTPNRNRAIEQITSLLRPLPRAAEWDQTPEWARIRHADVLILLERDSDANAEIESMSRAAQVDRHWTIQEKKELISLASRLPYAPEATSPVAIAKMHWPVSKELVTWAEKRQSLINHPSSADGSDSNRELDVLPGIIEESKLSAIECLRISELLADSHDEDGAEEFADVGANLASPKLWDAKPTDAFALSLVRGLERVEDRLWESTANPVRRGATLEKITSIFIHFGRVNPDDERPEWARIGHGEALYMQHQYAPALLEASKLAAESLKDPHFTDQQKIGVEWLHAIVLFDLCRYKEALPHLKATASSSLFRHSKDAWPLWAVALAKTGDAARANEIIDSWIRRDRPSTETVARILEKIQTQ